MANYNSYRIYRKQYSIDSGETWHDMDPGVGERRYVATYDSFDDCALNNYKAIYYYKSGEVKYVPCDGNDRLSGSYGGGEITLLVVGNCVRTLGPIGIVRKLQLPPNGILETIEDGAFSESGLGGAKTTLEPYIQYIPDTVKYIGNTAFDCTFVNEYHIGSGVTYVGWKAFHRGREENRKFYFYGKTPPEFPCGKNPPGWTFHTSGGTTSVTIKVPCGSEIAYYNAICSTNIDGTVRETIFDNIDDECNWSAKWFFKGSDKDKPYKVKIKKTTLGMSTDSGGKPTDIEISTEKQIYGIDYENDGDLNSITIPDNIWYIKRLSANSIEKFFMPSHISRLDRLTFNDVDYFEYGMTPLEIKEGALGVSGTTCRIGEYGTFGTYSGISLKFENVIIERDSAMDLKYAFKDGNIHNLYVKASAYDGYLNQDFYYDYYDNIYIIGEQTGTTWVPAKREYIYDEDTDEYYFKEYERKDFENGMYYFTQNYRKGALIPQRPYYVDLGEKETDVEEGIIWNVENLMLNTGDYEVPLYERKRTTPYQQYMYEYYYSSSGGSGSKKQLCNGTEITSSMVSSTAMTSIKIYNTCTTKIGDNAFANKPKLRSAIIGDSVRTIGNYSFSGAGNQYSTIESIGLKGSGADIELSNNLERIGTGAFAGITALTSATLPNSVITLDGYTFSGCSSMTECILSDNIVNFGSGIFYNCRNLTNITIPSGATRIGYSAFDGCRKLASIDIPDSVTSIGGYAFNYCIGLANVTIGRGVTSISEKAFQMCSSLNNLTIYATTPPTLESNVFIGTPSTMKIYVPAESLERYRNSWSEYASLIYPIS